MAGVPKAFCSACGAPMTGTFCAGCGAQSVMAHEEVNALACASESPPPRRRAAWRDAERERAQRALSASGRRSPAAREAVTASRGR